MSNIRDMVDAISSDNFDGARGALKASLAEYMAGKKYLSNEDVFGSEYTNPNKEEQEIKDELTESAMSECDIDIQNYREENPNCKKSDTELIELLCIEKGE